LAQTRRERRAYPSWICEERTTKSEPKRHAALRVAPLLGSGFVAPRSQPHFGGCSLVAPRQNPKSVQPMYSYLGDTTLDSSRRSPRSGDRRLKKLMVMHPLDGLGAGLEGCQRERRRRTRSRLHPLRGARPEPVEGCSLFCRCSRGACPEALEGSPLCCDTPSRASGRARLTFCQASGLIAHDASESNPPPGRSAWSS